MKTSYRYEVDEQDILVFDDVFKKNKILELYEFLSTMAFYRKESDTFDKLHIKSFAADFDIRRIKETYLFLTISALVKNSFPLEHHRVYRAYCNLGVYGDVYYPHRDSTIGSTNLTALYYANREWDRGWAGETIFYNVRGDSAIAVTPKPGRVILFRGAIEHRTGMVSRDCQGARLSVALKFNEVKKTSRARKRRSPTLSKKK